MLGPQISMSSIPTSNPLFERINANYEANVLFPTPPLPDNTKILCLIKAIFFAISI